MRTVFESPFGPLYLEASGRGLRSVRFTPARDLQVTTSADEQSLAESVLARAVHALQGYFQGDSRILDSLSLDMCGTEFQQAVWSQARKVPFGSTISYGDLAKQIGRPLSSRAVGAALGANPICIVVPCHRIVSSVGKLHGFSGGLELKAKLLSHESAKFDGREIACENIAHI